MEKLKHRSEIGRSEELFKKDIEERQREFETCVKGVK